VRLPAKEKNSFGMLLFLQSSICIDNSLERGLILNLLSMADDRQASGRAEHEWTWRITRPSPPSKELSCNWIC
jgi:hypothetical protein